MGALFLTFFVLVAHASSSVNSSQTPVGSKLLALFLDGARWDFLETGEDELPGGISEMRARGCHVSRIKPIFPSNCHANIHAVFAGHEKSHPETFSEQFLPNYTSPDLLWNKAAGQGKRVLLYHFPFCSTPSLLGNVGRLTCLPPPPDQSGQSAPKQPLLFHLDDVLKSMANGSFDFAAVYYGEFDRISHFHGPAFAGSKESEARRDVNQAVSAVMEALNSGDAGLADVNFVIVSDHGMTQLKGTLALDRAFKWDWISRTVNIGSMVALWPKTGHHENVVSALKAMKHFSVHSASNSASLPPSWGSLLSPMPPLLLVAEPGYVFQSSVYLPIRRDHPWENDPLAQQGQHGYPPDLPDMQTAFYAFGPAFKSKLSISPPDLYTYHVHSVLHDVLFSTEARGGLMAGHVLLAGRGGVLDVSLRYLLLLSVSAAVFVVCLVLLLVKVSCEVCRHRKYQKEEAMLVPHDDSDSDDDDGVKV